MHSSNIKPRVSEVTCLHIQCKAVRGKINTVSNIETTDITLKPFSRTSRICIDPAMRSWESFSFPWRYKTCKSKFSIFSKMVLLSTATVNYITPTCSQLSQYRGWLQGSILSLYDNFPILSPSQKPWKWSSFGRIWITWKYHRTCL